MLHQLLPAVIVLSFILSQPYTKAIAQSSSQEPKTPVLKWLSRKQVDYSAQKLRKPVDIPNLQPYPGNGAKLVRGLKIPNLGSGNITLLQSFEVKEAAEEVRNWYQSSLIGQGWSVRSANKTNTQLMAMHSGGQMCQVMVYPAPPGDAGYKTLLQVRYTQATSSIN